MESTTSIPTDTSTFGEIRIYSNRTPKEEGELGAMVNISSYRNGFLQKYKVRLHNVIQPSLDPCIIKS